MDHKGALILGAEVNLKRVQRSKSEKGKQRIICKEKLTKKLNLAISPKVLLVFNIFLTNPSLYVRK